LPAGAGMGTSGLVGQIMTVNAMGAGGRIILSIILLHFLFPGLIAYFAGRFLRRRGLIKEGDYKLKL
ncbi:MAG TPA: PTS sugar transporter subunit IIC, partial [Firmicutes bacterium]|nr:PTS sugar transporter subunit IIC [Bacillota bacterium]